MDVESGSKKRKRNSMSEIKPIPYLLCEICSNRVYNYRHCISPHIYCSYMCFEVIYLTYHSNFGRVLNFDEEDEMKE